MKPLRAAAGFTLIETLIAMVVVGIALTGFVSVFVLSFSQGADPLRERQALAIAEAYLEEILLRPYADPDTDLVCDAPEANRPILDDACDYNALSNNGCIAVAVTAACPLGTCACDQSGIPIAGLAGYSVAIAVTQVNVGPPNINALRAQVTVTVPGSSTNAQLVGHRVQQP